MLERTPACMTRPLSRDLRDRVIAVVDGGLSCNAAAERFGIAVSSAIRWVRAWRAEGRGTALRQGGVLRWHHIEASRGAFLAAIEGGVDLRRADLAALFPTNSGPPVAPTQVC